MDPAISRLQRYDNIKAFLIFLVVLGHIANIFVSMSYSTGVIRYYIYIFHMPLFIFVSGLFSKNHIDKKKWNKICSYLILYLLIKLLLFFFSWFATGKIPAFSLLSEGGVPWYAFCLFTYSSITVFIQKIKPIFIIIASILLGCLAGYFSFIGDYLCLSRFFVFYPFFYAGYLVNPDKLNDFLKSRRIIIASVIITCVAIVLITVFYTDIGKYVRLTTGRNPYSKLGLNMPCAFIFRMICYIASAVLGFAFMAMIPEKIGNGHIAKIGERSVQIYALHSPFKILWISFINGKFGLEKYFSSCIIIYVFLVAIIIFAVCALPFWESFFRKILNLPVVCRKCKKA